jgi:2-dehydro-3-deoxy-L-rhamnonate dehydrogenase (NAD+)
MQRFNDQVAIVAGGARGIGKGIAKRLASEGCKVIILDVLNKELAVIVEEFQSEQLDVQGEIIDMTNEVAVQAITQQIFDKNGRLDILVNSAGIIGESSGNIADYSTEVFNKVIDINLKGAFLLTKYTIPFMAKRQYGRILHVTSMSGKEGNPAMAGYAVSKAGIIGLVKAVGKEYAEMGITVNGIAPTVIATEINLDLDPAIFNSVLAKIPMKRMGTVEEVAALSCWIVSEEASFNTGFVFDLSGGRATY